MLDENDLALVEAARGAIRKCYKPDWHVIGAALRLKNGAIFTGVHLEAYVGRMAVCAEAIALGRAVTEATNSKIETIVAVRHPAMSEETRDIKIVTPCGMCREMISDYSPEAMVIIPAESGAGIKVPVGQLLPHKYSRA
jgi:cytidine deaminase